MPFAGELIEIDEREKMWQGAIERALRGFALSLLVDDRHYAALANALNNMHLNGRLIYFRINHAESVSGRKQIVLNSLVKKLNLKEGYYQNWLQRELEQRFDYACVDSLAAFRKEERALTREGQIRHNASRHEKDDRRAIDDRRYWVLGFDNREKLTLFERQAQTFAETIGHLTQEIDNLAQKAQHGAQRAMQCQTLVNLQWQEIDVAPVLNRISTIAQELQQIRLGNQKLQTLGERIRQQRDVLTQAEQAYRDLAVRQQVLLTEINDKHKKQTALQHHPLLTTELTPFQQQALSERFSQLRQVATLDNLDHLATQIERVLNKDLVDLEKNANQLEKEIENRFAEFKRQWPMEASDMDARLAAAQDFFAKLQRLQADNLPHFEQRFFDLLQSQSHQNLAALSTHISQARKTIFERLEWVNESLKQAAFNPGTYLHIDASDRQLPEVRDFKQAIQQVLSYAWSGERENAEERFLLLRNLVERLANQDAEHQRWRQLVLDVRQHVEFIAREKDAEGREIEIYRSGAGKSGGQRQKLATTCLAAALRYQLGGHERGAPVYAPVVLDEAFDKADNEFTALAMNIFTHFGFQMIVATPLKSVMTLEPFIGGACFVDIRDRRHSSVLLIEYDTEKQRLKVPEHPAILAEYS